MTPDVQADESGTVYWLSTVAGVPVARLFGWVAILCLCDGADLHESLTSAQSPTRSRGRLCAHGKVYAGVEVSCPGFRIEATPRPCPLPTRSGNGLQLQQLISQATGVRSYDARTAPTWLRLPLPAAHAHGRPKSTLRTRTSPFRPPAPRSPSPAGFPARTASAARGRPPTAGRAAAARGRSRSSG